MIILTLEDTECGSEELGARRDGPAGHGHLGNTGEHGNDLSDRSLCFGLRDVRAAAFDVCQVLGLNDIPLVRSPGF